MKSNFLLLLGSVGFRKAAEPYILLLFFVLGASLQAQVPTNGLLAYYPFNGNANDESGNGLNGTVNGGATLTTDRFGNVNSAYHFDGVDAYIMVNQSTIIEPTNGISVAAWINVDSGSTGSWIVRKAAPADGGYIMSLFGFGEDFQFRLDAAGLSCHDDVGTNMANIFGNWILLVGTYDLATTTAKLYVNGNVMDSINNACYPMSHTGNLYFAGDDFETSFITGKLDDIRIYNRALISTEVGELYAENSVAIEEAIFREVKVYPNPVNNELNILWNEQNTKSLAITLTDITGKMLFSQAINDIRQGENIGLEIGDFATGIYFLRLQGEGKTYRAKIVKE